MYSLQALAETLERHGLREKGVPLAGRLREAISIPVVRDILDLEEPNVTDLSEELGAGDGKVYAIRMDLQRGVDNHKKPVVAGLILRGVLMGALPREGIDTLIDAGNYNSAKAVKYYAARFGMKGIYIMSRHFPATVTDLLESDDFRIVRAPERADLGREREFYEFLFTKMKDHVFRADKICLWHAKYGGEAMRPFGEEIAKRLEAPDYVVSCLGAGSTLTGLQIPIAEYFATRRHPTRIVVAEHERSPLLWKTLANQRQNLPHETDKNIVGYTQVSGFPHIVIGPHYDEINPLLAQAAINRIDHIVQYSEGDWKATRELLQARGISVGNSSAANLSVAAKLARQRSRVATVIFEPFRDFYLASPESRPLPHRLCAETR